MPPPEATIAALARPAALRRRHRRHRPDDDLGRSSSRTTSSQTSSTTLSLVPKNSRKSLVSVEDQHPSRRDGQFIRHLAIPRKSGIASPVPYVTSSLSIVDFLVR